MSEQTGADIKAAALAELEGSNSSVEETTQTEETNPEVEAEATETVSEEVHEQEVEDSEEETTPEVTTETERDKMKEEVTKEVEREMKKKYYSKLNQEQKKLAEYKAELEALKASGYDDSTIDAVRAIVRSETQQQEMGRIEQIELDNFVNKFNPSTKDLKEIKEIVADFPGMSYEAARKMYLADHRPEELVKPKKASLTMPGGVPKSIEKGPDINDPSELLRQATEEANYFAGRNRF